MQCMETHQQKPEAQQLFGPQVQVAVACAHAAHAAAVHAAAVHFNAPPTLLPLLSMTVNMAALRWWLP